MASNYQTQAIIFSPCSQPASALSVNSISNRSLPHAFIREKDTDNESSPNDSFVSKHFIFVMFSLMVLLPFIAILSLSDDADDRPVHDLCHTINRGVDRSLGSEHPGGYVQPLMEPICQEEYEPASAVSSSTVLWRRIRRRGVPGGENDASWFVKCLACNFATTNMFQWPLVVLHGYGNPSGPERIFSTP